MVLQKTTNEKLKHFQDIIFENALIGMLIFSSEGKVLKYNKEAQSFFIHIDPLADKSFRDLFVVDTSFDFKHLFNASGANKNSTWESFLQINQKKNEVCWVNVHLNRIESKNIDEHIVLCQINKISITDNPEDNIEYLNNLLLELINNIPDNIFIKDTKSRFILANNNVATIMGASSPKELLGKTDFDFYPKKLAGKYFKDESEIIESGKAKLNIIEQVIDTNHNRNWFSTSKLPLTNSEGKIIGIMGIGRDITLLVKKQKALRKAKHEAEKADKLKSAFLANLSHEIRTPLNGIMGFSQFLSQYIPSDPKAKKYIDFILQNGKRLLHLISDIIDVSKIESNQLVITKRLFSLNELCKQLEHSIYEELNLYDKTHIALGSELSLPDNESYIYNDDQRIKQVLHNLLSNAVKFTPQGAINFGYRKIESQLYFYVKDTGIGIKEEDSQSIFELFTQVDNTLGRQYEGAGLGLSIAKGLVQLLGGKIGLNSQFGKGSEFYFTLPYTNKFSAYDRIRIDEIPEGKTRVLFIGSQPETIDFLMSDPLSKSMQIDFVDGKDDCIKYLQSEEYNPNLIICNMKLNKNWLQEQIKNYIKEHPEQSFLLITDSRSNYLLNKSIKNNRIETIREPVNNYLMIEKIKLLLSKDSNQ